MKLYPINHSPLSQIAGGAGNEYDSWKAGDEYLDLHGAEPGQQRYNNRQAEGTPMLWTTNDAHTTLYHPYNRYTRISHSRMHWRSRV